MLTKTILVFLSLTSPVISHCMYDFRLDYENTKELIETSTKYLGKYKANLEVLNSEKPESPVDFNVLKMQTDNFSKDSFYSKLTEKISSIRFNVDQIMENFCERIRSPIDYQEKLFSLEDYDIFASKCDISEDGITHSSDGEHEVMLKVIPVKNIYHQLHSVNLTITLSRVATFVRISQCLLNPMAYNLLDGRYENILNSINNRTSALNSLLLNTESDASLDSIPPIDCKYFTPKPKHSKSKDEAFDKHSIFYITYPRITSTLENIFFFEPTELERILSGNSSWLQNDFIFRLHICLRMVESLASLHQSSVILANIRLMNIFFFVSQKPSVESPFDQLSISFGNFSQSGIDNYDARVLKTFYVPEDGKYELGPKVDTFQLGLAMFQLLFMLPAEKTIEMSLSKIDKIKDPESKIKVDSSREVLFRELMRDAVGNKFPYKKYKEVMSQQALKCSIKIFQMIVFYFENQVWTSDNPNFDSIKNVFYNFRPKKGQTVVLDDLYLDDRFQSIFVSVFLNLFTFINTCTRKMKLPDSILVLLRSMLHPNVSLRIELKTARQLLLDEIEKTKNKKFKNILYSVYNHKEFSQLSKSTLLVRRNSKTTLF